MKRYLIFFLCFLFLMPVPAAYAARAQEVLVTVPSFKISINQETIRNKENKFPFIMYRNITYVPLTWDFANALSLEAIWDGKSLNIKKRENHYAPVIQDLSGNNSLTRRYRATIPGYDIFVNGEKINNAKEEFPILNFRGVTYFPLTWRFMVDVFGLLYHWSPESGLTLATEQELFRVFTGYRSFEDYLGRWESADGVFTANIVRKIYSPTHVEIIIARGRNALVVEADLSSRSAQGHRGFFTNKTGDLVFAEIRFENGKVSYLPNKSNMAWAWPELTVPIVFEKHTSYR
ncbi:MAG: hypothetical protein KGZ75_10500 [Syntrophomonadaceae bacterium]|nr:hypothetical protein [Syntrophomonadaceae bacterium]